MRQQVQRAGRRADLARSDAQVLGGGGQAAMTEQQLNGPQIGAGFEQMDSECVSQRMRCDRLGKSGQVMCFLTRSFDGIFRDRLVGATALGQSAPPVGQLPIRGDRYSSAWRGA